MEAQLALAEHAREPRTACGAQGQRGDLVLFPRRFRIGVGGFAAPGHARFFGGRFVPVRNFTSARRAAAPRRIARRRIARQRPAVEFQIIGIGRRDDLEGLRAELVFELRHAVLDAARRPRHILARLKHPKLRKPGFRHFFQRRERGVERLDRADKRQPLEDAQRPLPFAAVIGRFGHRQPLDMKIAAGTVAWHGEPRPQITGEIMLPREPRALGVGPLVALEQIGRFQPVERMADKQDGQDLGIWDVRRRQGKRVRRQRGDLRIGGEKLPGRIRRRARRIFARGPAGAEIPLQDRIDAGARVLKKMVVNNDRAPRRFGAYSRAGMSVTHVKSLAKARRRKVFLRPSLVNGDYGS